MSESLLKHRHRMITYAGEHRMITYAGEHAARNIGVQWVYTPFAWVVVREEHRKIEWWQALIHDNEQTSAWRTTDIPLPKFDEGD